MKRKATVGIIAIIILICSIVIFRSIYIQRSYYPMGGEVTILAKQADNYGYYITVEQGKPDDAGWGQFELKCTQEQYEAVDVGDVVKCDREQSIVTNSGTVHKIQKRYRVLCSHRLNNRSLHGSFANALRRLRYSRTRQIL